MPVTDPNGTVRFHSGVPYPDRPWDEIAPGLFLGGHYCQEGPGSCFPLDNFDMIVSLHQSSQYRRYMPTNAAWVLDIRIPDAVLDPRSHEAIENAAADVAAAHLRGKRVLVRCRAGINRSAMVMARVLMLMGASADEAIEIIRAKRSEHCLFNESFVAYLRSKDAA